MVILNCKQETMGRNEDLIYFIFFFNYIQNCNAPKYILKVWRYILFRDKALPLGTPRPIHRLFIIKNYAIRVSHKGI